MSARIEHVLVGGDPDAWSRLGMSVVDRTIWLHGAGVRLVDDQPGIHGWTLSGLDRHAPGERFDIDGLDSISVAAEDPVWVEHPLGVVEIDHVVVTTDDLERTSMAIEAATGAPLRRIRETEVVRQGFHRLGNVIVEVVAPRTSDSADGTGFYGIAFNLDDIDRAAALGDDLVGSPTPAVQPGRQIATVRPAAGLGLPVALMSIPLR